MSTKICVVWTSLAWQINSSISKVNADFLEQLTRSNDGRYEKGFAWKASHQESTEIIEPQKAKDLESKKMESTNFQTLTKPRGCGC